MPAPGVPYLIYQAYKNKDQVDLKIFKAHCKKNKESMSNHIRMMIRNYLTRIQ